MMSEIEIRKLIAEKTKLITSHIRMKPQGNHNLASDVCTVFHAQIHVLKQVLGEATVIIR